LNLDEKSEVFKGYTDAEGNFQKHSPGNITITITHKGFYSLTRGWAPDAIPPNRVTLTLEPAHAAVPMIGGNAHKFFDAPKALYTFGIQLIETHDVPNPDNITENPGNADVWIEARRIENQQAEDNAKTRKWTISIRSFTGWEFALVELSSGDTDPMREAVDDGYVRNLEFPLKECPSGVFLRHPGTNRYGKLYDLGFRDDLGANYGSFVFRTNYAVQTESSGTRSLNSKK
jgi:hypothetical protein